MGRTIAGNSCPVVAVIVAITARVDTSGNANGILGHFIGLGGTSLVNCILLFEMFTNSPSSEDLRDELVSRIFFHLFEFDP